mgnify:CR=1 FL=1
MLIPKSIFLISDRRKLILLKFKSTEELLLKKLTGLNLNSNKKLKLERSLLTTRTSTSAESLKEAVPLESSRDGKSPNFPERLTEVSERSPVLVHGIQLQSSGPAPELVNTDTSTEPNSTTRSTESDQELSTEPRTTLIAKTT